MSYRDLVLSINGLKKRDQMLEAWIRRATFIIGSSNVGGKDMSKKFDRLWPVEGEFVVRVSEANKRLLKKFRDKAARKALDNIRAAEAMERVKKKVADGRA